MQSNNCYEAITTKICSLRSDSNAKNFNRKHTYLSYDFKTLSIDLAEGKTKVHNDMARK